jgi:CheY-like chemotaxis protein
VGIRVVLADDQTVVRAGFRALLELTDDLLVVGVAADGTEAVAAVRRHRPDVVLMDIRMPGTDGLEAIRRIVADPALARSTPTISSSRRCGWAPAATCSKTSNPTICTRRSGSWRTARACSRRPSPPG